MTTSGVTSFSLTVRDHVMMALEQNAIIASGEEPTADELASCIRLLAGMLKTWQARGLTWKQETISVSLTGGSASVALPTYVRGVNGLRFVDSATNERQMARFERDEYYSLPNKAASGTPTIYYVAPGTAEATLYVWPVPASNSTVKADIDRQMDTPTNGGETIDLPDEWAEAVYLNLATRCAGIFGVQPSPYLVDRAAVAEREMLDAYRPASYFMGPY